MGSQPSTASLMMNGELHMKVLVTGSTGFVGSQVVSALLQKGSKPICLCRNVTKQREILGANVSQVEIITGDITCPETLQAALVGVEAVVHAAAITPSNNLMTEADVQLNMDCTANVIDSALKAGINKIIYISSVAAIFNFDKGEIDASYLPAEPKDAYSKSKYLSEAYVRIKQAEAGGERIHIVYPSGVIGPGDPGLSIVNESIAALVNQACMVTKGGTLMVDVRDLATFIVWLTANTPSESNHIVTGSYSSWEYFAETLNSLFEGKLKVVTLNPKVLLAIGAFMDFLRIFIRINSPVSKETCLFTIKMKPTPNSADYIRAVGNSILISTSLRDTIEMLRIRKIINR